MILNHTPSGKIRREVVINKSESPSPSKIKMLEEFFNVSFNRDKMMEDTMRAIAYGLSVNY